MSCCQVLVSATGQSFVQRSPTKCVCGSFSVIRSNSNTLHLHWVGRRGKTKRGIKKRERKKKERKKERKKETISGFRRDETEVFAFLGFRTVFVGSCFSTFRDRLSVPSSRVKQIYLWRSNPQAVLKRRVSNYQSTLRNFPEERIFHRQYYPKWWTQTCIGVMN